MKTTLALMLFVAAAAGCGPSATGNPPELWLALNGSEVSLRLAPVEPDPF